MDFQEKYQIVIGLEVHAQLATKTKLFSSDAFKFGEPANTNISPITLAHPGVLPMLNKEAIKMAIKMGLACHCTINPQSVFARKHYNYPDLPKGYQLTQHEHPICLQGFVPIQVDGYEKNISLHHIHLEEDAGKSLHDIVDKFTCVDYNRAGVPLIEIVSNPDMSNSQEVVAYMSTIQKIVRYLEICDGNMEDGNLRCDVNISVCLKGDSELGTKVEMKNLNSLRNIKNAIEFEAQRLMLMKENKEEIVQQTRGFDVETNCTYTLRSKENSDDYRYINDPDLPPIIIDDNTTETIKNSLPILHFEREKKYVSDFKLSPAKAKTIAEEKDFAIFFENVADYNKNYKATANWVLGPIKNYLNTSQCKLKYLPLSAKQVSEIIEMVEEKIVNYSDASSKLLLAYMQQPKANLLMLATSLQLVQSTDTNTDNLQATIQTVCNDYAEKVKEYRFQGKKGLIGFFVGETVKRMTQKIDPKIVNETMKSFLEK